MTESEELMSNVLRAAPHHRLFVYGTLMSVAASGYGQAAQARLLREAPHRVAARTSGKLYELGRYPGFVAGATADQASSDVVHGELLVLADPLTTLAWLDDYEGISAAVDADNEYARRMHQITAASGQTLSAWAYVYVKPVQNFSRIANGRWR